MNYRDQQSPVERVAIIDIHPASARGHVAGLAMGLGRAGCDVDVFLRRDDPSQPDCEWLGPRVRLLRLDAGLAQPLDDGALLPLVPAFIHACSLAFRQRAPYTVMHAHRTLSGLVALRLKETFGIPYLASFESLALDILGEPAPHDPLIDRRLGIERRVIAAADGVIAGCPRQFDALFEHYGVREEALAMVPAGVDTAHFRPRMPRQELRRDLGWDDNEYILLQLGRLSPRKGTDNVIRALARLGPRMNARLMIAGGEYAGRREHVDYLRDAAHRCGVESRITFLGELDSSSVPGLIAAADVLVDTPWHEPLGRAPLEAMATGIPVIASDVGAASYQLADGITGFLVRPRDPIGLAMRLEQLHANPLLASSMGQAGAERARALFAWEAVSHQVLVAIRGARKASPVAHATSFQAGMDRALIARRSYRDSYQQIN